MAEKLQSTLKNTLSKTLPNPWKWAYIQPVIVIYSSPQLPSLSLIRSTFSHSFNFSLNQTNYYLLSNSSSIYYWGSDSQTILTLSIHYKSTQFQLFLHSLFPYQNCLKLLFKVLNKLKLTLQMAEPLSSRELEWFDLQTRMRELLSQKLQPIINRAKLDREAQARLQTSHQQLEHKVKHLETFTFGDSEGQSVIQQIYSKFDQVEINRKSDRVAVDQICLSLKENIRSNQFQISGCQEMNKRLENMIELINQDIRRIKDLIDNHQALVVKEMEGLNQAFIKMNETYTSLSVKTQQKAQRSLNNSKRNITELGGVKGEMQSLKNQYQDCRREIRDLHIGKLSAQDFSSQLTSLKKIFDQLQEQDQKIHREIITRDAFVDKYIPLKISSLLSDALHFSLDPHQQKKLAEYQHSKLQDLNTQVLNSEQIDSRQQAVDKILDQIKHVEQRQVEIITEGKNNLAKQGGSPKEPPSTGEPYRKSSDTRQPGQTLVFAQRTINIEQHLQSFMLDSVLPQLLKLKTQVLEKQEILSKNLKIRSDQGMVFTQQVLTQVEELAKKQKKEKGETLLLISQAKQTTDEMKKESQGVSEMLSSLALMVVCLVENAQIQHALEAQDQKDRHQTSSIQKEPQAKRPQLAVYSTAVPQANFAVQKKSFSGVQTNSVLTRRPNMVYKPTPLFYRNQKLKRLELISLMGRMLETCWGMVSNSIPWSKNDFEQVLNEASRFIKRSQSYVEERKGEMAEQSSKESLPILVVPTSRNRTPGLRRNKTVNPNH